MKPFFSLLIFLAVASFCADIACKVIDMKTSACVISEEEESSESGENESKNEPDSKIKLREFEFIDVAIQYEYCFAGEAGTFKSIFAFHPDLGQYTQTKLFSPPEMM